MLSSTKYIMTALLPLHFLLPNAVFSTPVQTSLQIHYVLECTNMLTVVEPFFDLMAHVTFTRKARP